jgi:hypothetical protein
LQLLATCGFGCAITGDAINGEDEDEDEEEDEELGIVLLVDEALDELLISDEEIDGLLDDSIINGFCTILGFTILIDI